MSYYWTKAAFFNKYKTLYNDSFAMKYPETLTYILL